MGFLERFGLRRTPPRHDWIDLVGNDLVFERDVGKVRVWRFSDGDAAGVYFFNLQPDLPKTSDFGDFLSRMRAAVTASGAALVDCTIVTLDHIPAIRQITKVPQQPTGMTYLGAFTLAFAEFSYVLKVQCEERGVTGAREAVLLDEALHNRTVTLNPASPAPIQGGWDPDSEGFDERFPNHPLPRLRSHLRQLESCVHIDKRALQHDPFPLPRFPG